MSTLDPSVESPNVIHFDHPQSFKGDCNWIAIKTSDAQAVVKALDLTDPVSVTFTGGMEALSNDFWDDDFEDAHLSRVFVSSPISEWTLVIGHWTKSSVPALTDVARMCEHLSDLFGCVHAYSVKSVHMSYWVFANKGQIESICEVNEEGEVFERRGDLCTRDRTFFDGMQEEDTAEEVIGAAANRYSVNPYAFACDNPTTSLRGFLATTPVGRAVQRVTAPMHLDVCVLFPISGEISIKKLADDLYEKMPDMTFGVEWRTAKGGLYIWHSKFEDFDDESSFVDHIHLRLCPEGGDRIPMSTLCNENGWLLIDQLSGAVLESIPNEDLR